jgi:2-keto-3-deoxygluconate permease
VAAASTAGNAVAVPVIVAAVNPAYGRGARQATVLIACVVVTAILVPVVTAMVARRVAGGSQAPTASS